MSDLVRHQHLSANQDTCSEKAAMAESGFAGCLAPEQTGPSRHEELTDEEANTDGGVLSDASERSGACAASGVGDVVDDAEHWPKWLERHLRASGGKLMPEHRFEVVVPSEQQRQKIVDGATSRIGDESSVAFMWRLCSLLLWQNYLGDEERRQLHFDMSFLDAEEAARICEWARFVVGSPRRNTGDVLRQRVAAGRNKAMAAVAERTRPAPWVSHEGPVAGPYWLLGSSPFTDLCAGLTDWSRPNRNFKTQATELKTWGAEPYWHAGTSNSLGWGLHSDFGGRVMLQNPGALFNSKFDDSFEEWVLFPCTQLLQDDLITRSDQQSTNSLTRSHHILKFLLSCAQQPDLRAKWLREGWAATLVSRDMQEQIFRHVHSVKGSVKTQLQHLQSIIHKHRSLYAMVMTDMTQHDAPDQIHTALSKFVKGFWTRAASLKFLSAAKALRAAKRKQKLGAQPKEVASCALWVACVLAVQCFVRDVWDNPALWASKLKTLTQDRDHKGFHEITKKVMLCATTGCFGVCRTNQLLAAKLLGAGSTQGELPRGETRGFVYEAACGEIVFRYTAKSIADKLRFLPGPRHGLRWPPMINHLLRWYLEEVKPREYALFGEDRDPRMDFVVFLKPILKPRTKQKGSVAGYTLKPYAHSTTALRDMLSMVPGFEKLIKDIVATHARPNLRAAAATYFASEADRTARQNAFDGSSKEYWVRRLQGSMTMGHSLQIELDTYDFSSGNNDRKADFRRLLESGTAKWLQESWCNMRLKEWRQLLQANMRVRYLSVDGVPARKVFELPDSVRAGENRKPRPLRWKAWTVCRPKCDSDSGGAEREDTAHETDLHHNRGPYSLRDRHPNPSCAVSDSDGGFDAESMPGTKEEKIAAAQSTDLHRASGTGSEGFGGRKMVRDSPATPYATDEHQNRIPHSTPGRQINPSIVGSDSDGDAGLDDGWDSAGHVPSTDDDPEETNTAAQSTVLPCASDAGNEGFGGTSPALHAKRLRATTAPADRSDPVSESDDGSARARQQNIKRRKRQHWKFHLIIPVAVWIRVWKNSSVTGKALKCDRSRMLALAEGAIAFSGSVVKSFMCCDTGEAMATVTFRTGANLVLSVEEATKYRVADTIVPNSQTVVTSNELGGKTARSKPRRGERFMGAITKERICRIRNSTHRAAEAFVAHVEKMKTLSPNHT